MPMYQQRINSLQSSPILTSHSLLLHVLYIVYYLYTQYSNYVQTLGHRIQNDDKKMSSGMSMSKYEYEVTLWVPCF